MDDVQQDYRLQLNAILHMKVNPHIKTRLVQNLMNRVKESLENTRNVDNHKCRGNYQVLSTSISDSFSMSYHMERDVEELQEKIIKLRLVKFQNNEEIETMEEELYEMQKIVKARLEYNDFLKRQIDSKMQRIQWQAQHKVVENKTTGRQKSKSVLNKSIDTVAGMLKISKWWN